MSRSALLLLLFAACAAPQQRREFRDGAPLAPVEPRTVYTPAGAGLPEYWGQPEAKPERSPYTRVLPQTPETMKGPGIWAAKEPDGRDTSEPALLLDTSLPYPDDDSPVVADKCAKGMSEAVEKIDRTRRRDGFSHSLRTCIAARLYLKCISTLEEDEAKSGVVNLRGARTLKKTRDVADAFERNACDGVEWPHIAHAYVIGVHHTWISYVRVK